MKKDNEQHSEQGGGKHETDEATGTKLWGGRFSGGVDPEVDRFTRSFSFDTVLAPFDVIASFAHAVMLTEREVLDSASGSKVQAGLAQMHRELRSGELVTDGDFEDVHAWIEHCLTARVGESGKRLHTARSRNDQVATAQRLWLREQIETAVQATLDLASAFVNVARAHLSTPLPGYTHLQRGQPVSLAHHLLAYAWMLEADLARLRAAHLSAGTSPLGAAALAGTTFDIDPQRSAELLGFERTFPNSMFAVADRDYVVNTSFACALLQVHLSRFAEEVVLWTSTEVGFAELDDSVAKGSSIMPQKKNPEPAEILRGKSGRVIGDLVAHLVQLKGLPLTYNSDLQEDKEALFDAVATVQGSLRVARSLLRGLTFVPERMEEALSGGFVTATDLADALVRRGCSFRDAHEQTGAAVRMAEQQDCELWELSLADLETVCPNVDEGIFGVLTPRASLEAHASPGGPAPERVAEQISQLVAALADHDTWLKERPALPVLAMMDRAIGHER